MIRHVLISACDAAIITMLATAVLAYVFRWQILIAFAVVILARAL